MSEVVREGGRGREAWIEGGRERVREGVREGRREREGGREVWHNVIIRTSH